MVVPGVPNTPVDHPVCHEREQSAEYSAAEDIDRMMPAIADLGEREESSDAPRRGEENQLPVRNRAIVLI